MDAGRWKRKLMFKQRVTTELGLEECVVGGKNVKGPLRKPNTETEKEVMEQGPQWGGREEVQARKKLDLRKNR